MKHSIWTTTSMRLFKFIETNVNALNVSNLPIFEIFRVSIPFRWEGKKILHEYNDEGSELQ